MFCLFTGQKGITTVKCQSLVVSPFKDKTFKLLDFIKLEIGLKYL